jgi:hypothetical protein
MLPSIAGPEQDLQMASRNELTQFCFSTVNVQPKPPPGDVYKSISEKEETLFLNFKDKSLTFQEYFSQKGGCFK